MYRARRTISYRSSSPLHSTSYFSGFLLYFSLCLLAHAQSTVALTALSYPAPTQSVSKSWTDEDTFKKDILNSTNTYRDEHNATALKWNGSLAESGQQWADGCQFDHSGESTGENLAAGYQNVSAAIEGWGNERKKYSFKKGNFEEATGHFTQLVWKNTTAVGCGKKECGDNTKGGLGWYIVCEYYPTGNVIGAFKSNVQSMVSDSAASTTSSFLGPTRTGASTTLAAATTTKSMANLLALARPWMMMAICWIGFWAVW